MNEREKETECDEPSNPAKAWLCEMAAVFCTGVGDAALPGDGSGSRAVDDEQAE